MHCTGCTPLFSLAAAQHQIDVGKILGKCILSSHCFCPAMLSLSHLPSQDKQISHSQFLLRSLKIIWKIISLYFTICAGDKLRVIEVEMVDMRSPSNISPITYSVYSQLNFSCYTTILVKRKRHLYNFNIKTSKG